MIAVSVTDETWYSAIVPFIPASRFFFARPKSEACTNTLVEVRFSAPLFSSNVIKLNLHLNQMSSASSSLGNSSL